MKPDDSSSAAGPATGATAAGGGQQPGGGQQGPAAAAGQGSTSRQLVPGLLYIDSDKGGNKQQYKVLVQCSVECSRCTNIVTVSSSNLRPTES